MDPPVSLHVCSLHNPPMDPPVSLHVFFLVTTTNALKCVLSSETTHGSTSVIACVFFSLTATRVIACVFFSHTTYGSPVSLHLCSLHIPLMDPPFSLHVCSF